MQTYLLIFSLHMLTTGAHGEWCNANTGSQFCLTGCCGTYWNRTCCPTIGKLCNINGENIYCPAGCCGINHFNRTCCPATEKPVIRNTTWRPTTRYPTWKPTTRYPTWHPDTDRPNIGVWCTHRGGRIYCRYGCCGTYEARSCCSSTGSPDVTSNPEALKVSTHTIIVIVVSCLAAIIGVMAILIGVYCCLRTGQGARGHTVCPPIATVSPNIQAGAHSTGPIYTAPVTAVPPCPTAFSNRTYMATPSNSDIVIHNAQDTVVHSEGN